MHHSNEKVEDLQTGTLLTHLTPRDDIFSNSKVLMVEFIRGYSIVGIILNKVIRNSEGQIQRIGGPCEISHKTILHNIEGVGNRVIEGVWEGGEVDQYRELDGYRIIEFSGYASWFEGQLDGEILNGNGWSYTNQVSANDVLFSTNLLPISGEYVGI